MAKLLSANSAQPPLEPMTAHQAAFVAEYVANGGNGAGALRTVLGEGKPYHRIDAVRLLRVPAVAARLAELRRMAGEALNSSVAELALQCYEIATTSAADMQPIDIHACRVCASADGKHPAWTDVEEFTDACEAWEASLQSGKALRKPSAAGGFTYDPFAPVNPTCKGCVGRGVQSVRVVATADLSPGAKMLYAGAQTMPDGTVRPMFEDRAKYRDMLHKLLGLYTVKTESKSFNVNYNLTAPAAAQAPLSADDALAKLRALGMLCPDDDTTLVSEQ